MGKWSKALINNEYSQTQGVLCNGEAYCCMGVRYEVEGLKFNKDYVGNFIASDGCQFFPGSKYSDEWNLNTIVTEEEDYKIATLFPATMASFEGQSRVDVLSDLNDGHNATFTEIGNLIEQLGWDNSDDA